MLFTEGLEALRTKPLEIRQQWLRRVTLARERDEEAVLETFHSERQVMSRWLGLVHLQLHRGNQRAQGIRYYTFIGGRTGRSVTA
jgi:hypothetical protein